MFRFWLVHPVHVKTIKKQLHAPPPTPHEGSIIKSVIVPSERIVIRLRAGNEFPPRVMGTFLSHCFWERGGVGAYIIWTVVLGSQLALCWGYCLSPWLPVAASIRSQGRITGNGINGAAEINANKNLQDHLPRSKGWKQRWKLDAFS